mmetsp:Transcript_13246/g.13422  ORF Transcript_13246/g.13422 Transcript_13246/m.13422 type:complete len:105 (-) Transcript_13246:554-868(-)
MFSKQCVRFQQYEGKDSNLILRGVQTQLVASVDIHILYPMLATAKTEKKVSQIDTFIQIFHRALSLFSFQSIKSFLILFLKCRIFSNSIHWTILTSTIGTIIAS